jgi:hypothetical protein
MVSGRLVDAIGGSSIGMLVIAAAYALGKLRALRRV